MKQLKNAVLSFLATVAIIAFFALAIASVLGFIKLCANYGAWVFVTSAFVLVWGGVHYEMKTDGVLE